VDTLRVAGNGCARGRGSDVTRGLRHAISGETNEIYDPAAARRLPFHPYTRGAARHVIYLSGLGT